MRCAWMKPAVITLLVAAAACTQSAGPVDGNEAPPVPSGPLHVSAMGPSGELSGPVQVYVTFDKPVTKLGELDDAKARQFLKVTPHIPGNYRFLGTNTVVFEPTGDVPRSTRFVAEVPSTARAVDGSNLQEPARTEFTSLQLRLTQSYPRAKATALANTPSFRLTFNQPVDARALSQHVGFVAGAAQPVSAKCEALDPKEIPNSYTCVPIFPLPDATQAELKIATGLSGAEGPMTIAEEVRIPFTVHGPLQVESVKCNDDCRPERGATIRFTTRVIPKQALPFVEVTPALQNRGEGGTYATPSVYLGNLQPSTQYQVTIKKGLPDEFGQTLKEDQSFSFKTQPARPMAQAPGGFITMEPGRTSIRITSVNAERATVRLWKVAADEAPVLARALGVGYSDVKPRAPDETRELPLPGKLNDRVSTALDFSSLLTDGTGIVGYSITFPKVMQWEDHAKTVNGFIQVTSLGVTTKSWPRGALGWVTELSTGRPLSAVDIMLMDDRANILWAGNTDEAGLAAAEANLPTNTQAWIVARRGNDIALSGSNFGEGLSTWDLGAEGAWPSDNGDAVGLIFTDRGVYKPGETINIKILARVLQVGELTLPRASKGTLIITGPTGDEVTRKSLRISSLGTAQISVPLDSGARLGNYGLRFTLGTDDLALYNNILVEQFKAPDFKVEISTSAEEVVRGATIKADARTMYLFGAPVVGAKSTATITLNTTSFTPPGAQGFTFDDESRWYTTEYVPDSTTLATQEQKTDATGNATFSVTVNPAEMRAPANAVFEVTSVDAAGVPVTGRATVLVHPAEFYLGVRTDNALVKAGAPVKVEAVALRPDGTPANASADIVLRRREYKAVKQQALGDSEETLQSFVDTEVARCSLQGLAKDPKSCQVTAEKPGLHLLAIEGKDAAGNPVRSVRVLWVWGPGEAPWATDDSLAIKLIPDKKTYQPGDVAKVLIQNPFPDADALITVERGAVGMRKVMRLEGNAPVVEIPVGADDVPNVFVGAVVIRGRKAPPPEPGKPDNDKPAVRAGYAKLVVDPGTRRIGVSIKPNADVFGPRDKVEVQIGLKDAKGAPTAGEVALFVVDESVLQLTGFQTPDPISILYATRGVMVRTGDNRVHLVDARDYGEKAEEPGGGGLGDLLGEDAVRRRFLTTAYFNPTIRVGADGTAKVDFELPDNLTAFRIMALAVGEGHRVGSAQHEIRVRKPLMLRPASPRILRVGDEAMVGGVIVNSTEAAGDVEIGMENQTPDQVQLSANPQTVQVAAGASQAFRVRVKAVKPGRVKLRFAARMGTHTDGLEVAFDVVEVMPMLHDATYGTVAAGKTERIPLGVPEKVMPDVGGVTLAVSTSVLAGMRSAAEQLRLYPYECMEQTAGKLLAIVEMGRYAQAYDGSENAQVRWQKDMGRAVQKVLSFQNDDGGFGFWPGRTSDAWLTAYALLALSRAQQAGVKVSLQSVHRGVAYLKKALNHELLSFTGETDDETRALGVDVLAILNDPLPAQAARLLDRRASLSLDVRALLGHALALMKGHEANAKLLLDDLAGHVHQSPKGATVQAGQQERGPFDSTVRSHALVLRALTAGGKHQQLADKLTVGLIAQQQDGRYRTTQEGGWAMMAVHDFQQAYESGSIDLAVTADLAGSQLLQAQFEERSPRTAVVTAPLSRTRGELSIAPKGEGTLRYGVTISYAPTELPSVPMDRGMFVERRVEAVDGKPIKGNVLAGNLQRLTIEVATPMDREFVVVDVPVPAGLELVNARFVTSETLAPPSTGPDEHEMEGGEYDAPHADPLLQGVFDHVELRDERLVLFATRMPRGLHRYVIGVRSVTPGNFAFSPARAEQMYAPEVFGLTAGTTLIVDAAKGP